MDERDTQKDLRDLGRRLDAAQRARQRPGSGTSQDGGGGSRSALGLAFRIGVELVVAVVVGLGLGWAFDNWLGTRPWGMIVFFFLGVAAGMMNVYRAVMGLGGAVGYRRGETPAAKKDDWSDDEE
jgi:ATP synthase protein I